MGAFWADARSLFETARQASETGAADCDLAIIVSPQGGIRMLPAEGWALPSLLAHHGGETVYRVTREHGSVRLEGRSGSQTCLLGSESPAATARRLLSAPLPFLAAAAGSAPPLALPIPSRMPVEA